MNFDTTFNYLIADLAAVQQTELEKKLSEVGIHFGQVFILFELWKEDGLSQINLAKNLNLSPPTINRLVKGLHSLKYIKMIRSETDNRVVNIYLTEKGLKSKPDIETVWNQMEVIVTGNLTETEKLIFMQLLEKILLNFYNDQVIK